MIERNGEPAGAQDLERGDVVREFAGGIAPPVRLFRDQLVEPELDVPAGERLTVRPAVRLELDGGDRLVARGGDAGLVGQAVPRIQANTARSAEPVQRPPHEVFRVRDIGAGVVRNVEQRKYVVELLAGRQGDRRRAAGDADLRLGRRRVARRACGQQHGANGTGDGQELYPSVNSHFLNPVLSAHA